MLEAVFAPGSIDDVRVLDPSFVAVSDERANVAPYGAIIYVRGWALAVDDGGISLPDAVSVVLGEHRQAAQMRLPREDIAVSFGDARLRDAGFEAFISVEWVPIGTYPIDIVVATSNGEITIPRAQDRTIEIVDSGHAFRSLERDDALVLVEIESIAPTYAPVRSSVSPIAFDRDDVAVVRGRAKGVVDRRIQAVYGVVDDRHYVRGVHGQSRPPASFDGITIRVALSDLVPGLHRIRVASIAGAGLRYALSEPLPFIVSDEPARLSV